MDLNKLLAALGEIVSHRYGCRIVIRGIKDETSIQQFKSAIS